MQSAPLRVTSPAKVNLYLHVTGKRDDGYHLLDSMAVFVKGVEDRITIAPAQKFSFHVNGSFAQKFSGKDLSAEQDSSNLVVKSAYAFAELSGIAPTVSVTLEKNIPTGAGLGGGSGDAATTFCGLEKFFDLEIDPVKRNTALLKLGADVPVCYTGHACRFQGIGEIIDSCPPLPETYILLVWPNEPSMTGDVFSKITPDDYKPPAHWPEKFASATNLQSFLATTTNSLTRAAIDGCPAIADALTIIGAQTGCHLTRMSGSGSCVFGLFENKAACEHAKNTLQTTRPDWWTQSGQI